MKNYKVLWGIILILILVVGSLSVLIFLNINQLNNLRNQSASDQKDISSLESELAISQQEFTDTTKELSSCESRLSTTEENLQATEQELLNLTQSSQDEIQNLEDQLKTSRDQLTSKLRELGELKTIELQYNKLVCDSDSYGQLNMDYSSIQTSSSRLQGFVANLPDVDHTSYTFRNTLWNNRDSKIHSVRYVSTDGNTYSRQFLVYADDGRWNNATFNIGGQCWLDPP